MKKFKSSMRLRKAAPDVESSNRESVQTAALKRSNAKLHKREQSSVGESGNAEELDRVPELPASDSPVYGDIFRSSSFHLNPLLSREYSWEEDQLESLPNPPSHVHLGMVSFENPLRKTGDTNKTFSKLFSKIKPKQKYVLPADNFPVWDSPRPLGRYGLAPHPSNLKSVGMGRTTASSLFAMGAAISGPPDPHAAEERPVDNPRAEDIVARQNPAEHDAEESNQKRSDIWNPVLAENDSHGLPGSKKGKWKKCNIEDFELSKHEMEELDSLILISDWNECFLIHDDGNGNLVRRASPIDSGTGLAEENDVGVGSSTGRRLSPEGIGHSRGLHAQRKIEIPDQRQEHIDYTHALQIQQGEILQARNQKSTDHAYALQNAHEQDHRSLQVEHDADYAAQLQLQLEEEEETAAAAQLANERECVCCGDSLSPLDFPATAPTPECTHPSSTCHDCIKSWLATSFAEHGTALACPECAKPLPHAFIFHFASPDTFTAYDKLLTRNTLSAEENFAWCLASGCSHGQENVTDGGFDEAELTYMRCGACSYKQCLKCCCAWHSGETCEQYQYRSSGRKAKEEEEATEKMIDSVSKKCPGQNCGWRIQKLEGCDHMTCKKCKFEFCWECLASHREIKRVGNTAHTNGCKFHSANLETSWPFNVHR